MCDEVPNDAVPASGRSADGGSPYCRRSSAGRRIDELNHFRQAVAATSRCSWRTTNRFASPRGGDTASGIVGVLNDTWGDNAVSPNAYRIRPVNALDGVVNVMDANVRRQRRRL
jgi:hypothetical protein